ncbi:hypothetical protein GCM10007978_24150 [Shewanella hanedai]|uniref:Uncharacterized protein n=1 Tax=Shewanella hanedai TaxID=25 RepID=A0A553JN48_SHEHA|nr:hypothetical protein [Shewanella hanedai]TRY13830.1 hypothetical protein FN961_13000 [Shewanella hanedai]GGI85650.1 hypothetical protein GCM10007978_24150 [Shewanella hanedai]
MGKINVFLATYSDDQIYLEMIERLVNEHPVEGCVPESIKYSSFSRMWIVMSVGSIETMITEWTKDQPMLFDLRHYADNNSNEEKIQSLINSFKLRGILIEEEYFKDYLAIKYIRNAYVHGGWNKKQKDYVQQRGFRTNFMMFEKSNFDRFRKVHYHIQKYLGLFKLQNDHLSRANSDLLHSRSQIFEMG